MRRMKLTSTRMGKMLMKGNEILMIILVLKDRPLYEHLSNLTDLNPVRQQN